MEQIKDTLQNYVNGAAANLQPFSTDRTPQHYTHENDCPVCRGMGFVYHDLPVGHPDFGKAFPCPVCSAGRLDEYNRKNSGLTDAEINQISSRILSGSATDQLRDVLKAMIANPSGIITAWGPPGVGKTHMLKYAVAKAIAKGHSAHYTTLAALFDFLRAAFAPGSDIGYEDRWNFLLNVRLLAIDEYSLYNPTPWAEERWFSLLDHRYSHRWHLGTLLSSNDSPNILPDLIASRIFDVENKVIALDGDDLRQYNRS